MRLPDEFVQEVRERSSLVAVAGRLTPLRRTGREWEGRCPFHAEKTPSFTVSEAKGFAHCFGCGWHGGVFRLVQEGEGVGFRDAVERLAAEAGLTIPGEGAPRRAVPLRPRVAPRAPELDREERENEMLEARLLFASARPAVGTLAQTYLCHRGIGITPPASLRFCPELKHWDAATERELWFPCMVAAMQDVERRIVGAHRTWLAADGKGKAPVAKAKKMKGQSWGAAIRLAPAGPTLGVAEGIETGASVMEATGLPVWAAGSLGNLAGAGIGRGKPHPTRDKLWIPSEVPDMGRPGLRLPPEIKELVILADADGDPWVSPALIERAVRRFQSEGRKVRVAWPRPGADFNDMWRGAA